MQKSQKNYMMTEKKKPVVKDYKSAENKNSEEKKYTATEKNSVKKKDKKSPAEKSKPAEKTSKLQNYKITVQYEGTRYQGWQKQETTANTLQTKFEQLLARICEVEDVSIHASGRTDAGVHAKGQVISVLLPWAGTTEELMQAMNRYLPEDVAVSAVQEVPERFHARLNATKKTYQYRLRMGTVPDVFSRRFVYEIAEVPDIALMKEASSYLLGKHDFSAFTSNRRLKKSAERTIHKIAIERVRDEIQITVEGDGFLYHMVRIMVGTLLEAGMCRIRPQDIQGILQSKLRENAGPLVPPQGLTLLGVSYED